MTAEPNNRTVSITELNRGNAGKIFEEVRRTGAKVAIKNNKPVCVLISPEEYGALTSEKGAGVLPVGRIKEIATALGAKYGAEQISLFGSYARGEATEKSDVDLMIEKGKVRGLQMSALHLDLKEALGKEVDLISKEAMDKELLKNAERDEVVLYARQQAD